MTNYYQILQDFKGIAYYHPQINSFGVGDITQITMDIETKKEPKYSKMYVVPGQTILNQNVLTYQFSIIILDRIDDDYSNQRDVMSDTLETAKDIFTILYQSYTAEYGDFSLFYEPAWGPNCTPFLERFETVLGGWTLNITINQPFDYNSCVLPISGLTLPTSLNYVNYKQIISDLEQIAIAHQEVNSFGYGDLTQITMDVQTKKEPKYTRMYVLPADTILTENQLTLNFTIIIADRLDDDYSNQQEVLSDTLEICKDVYTVLYLSEYETEWGATVEPFLERFETTLCGWSMNITLTQPFDYNRCELPERSFIPGATWGDLAELWNTINDEWEDV